MSKPTSEQIAREQFVESDNWAYDIHASLNRAWEEKDHDTISMLHRNLAGVMRRLQQRQQEQERT